MVRSPFDGGFRIATLFLIRFRDGLAGNNAAAQLVFGRITASHSGNAYPVVVNGGYRARHMGSVVGRGHIGRIGNEIKTGVRQNIGRQILVIQLDTAVHNRDNHFGISGSIIAPNRVNAHIGTRHPGRGAGAVVPILPLAVQLRIVERNAGRLGLHNRLKVFHSGNLLHQRGHPVRLDGRAVMDPIPAVQAHLPGSRLKFSGIRENAFHAGNTRFPNGVIEGGRFGGYGSFLYHPGRIFVQIDIGGSAYVNTAADFFRRKRLLGAFLRRKRGLLRLIPLAGAQQDQRSQTRPIESFIHVQDY